MEIEILIILLAGWGAGIVTGLVGASAVVIVAPVLITFLGYTPYVAIGISLATDVVASSISAYTFQKHGNLKLKEGFYLAMASVTAAMIGSWLSNYMSPSILGGSTGFVILFMGISFLRKPLDERLKDFQDKFDLSFWKKRKTFSAVIFGGVIGLMTGFFGAGGGMMILMVLTFIYGFSIHVAVGTSVLIMTFNALLGSISHFIVNQHIPYFEVLVSGFGGLIGAVMAAVYANTISEKNLSKIVGGIFVILGIISVIN
ncbi:sulfite exporter TauE/SafE family protein [Halanaerobaculum tunisiense]